MTQLGSPQGEREAHWGGTLPQVSCNAGMVVSERALPPSKGHFLECCNAALAVLVKAAPVVVRVRP